MSNPITQVFVEHITKLEFSRLPDEVIEKCKILLLDFLGIPFKASDLESSRIMVDSIAKEEGRCMVLGFGIKTTQRNAALINGTLAHSLDFDDTHRESSIHPGAAIIPLLLAFGDVLDGKSFIEAMVAGYDVACRLGMAINPAEHYSRGFHGTATCGLFGCIAAGSKVLGFKAENIENAFGIALSMVAGSMQFLENGSWNKRLHPGLAAHNAILALNLAKNGFVGAAKPFEGKYGFLNSYSAKTYLEKALEIGERYEVLFTGIKPYPCCRYIHPAVDLVLQSPWDVEDIMDIKVELTSAGYRIVGEPLDRKQNPENVVDAQFSMPFALAVSLLKGKLTVSEFTREVIHDTNVRKFMKKIEVMPSNELDKEYPKKWPVILRIKTMDGGIVKRKDYPSGEPEDPLNFDQVAKKFRSLVEDKIEPKAVIEFIKKLEKKDISELFEILDIKRER
jgi:2-methylcitrate dehydratase PrpD